MPTAILSALPEEQGQLLASLTGTHHTRHAGRSFHSGVLHGQPVVLALSGIGKVAAATTATLLIERLGAKRIVFTGVAGGLGDSVAVGDVVVARSYLQHDLDASPIFPRWELPGYGRTLLVCDDHLSTLLLEAASACVASAGAIFPSDFLYAPQVHQGLMVSGDRFVSSASESSALRSALRTAGHNPLAVEMEGAAVAQVCHDYQIPFAAVRTISDRADDEAHTDFPAFVREVASRYAECIIDALLRRLTI